MISQTFGKQEKSLEKESVSIVNFSIYFDRIGQKVNPRPVSGVRYGVW